MTLINMQPLALRKINSLVLTKAQTLSKRSGVGWAIVDENNTLLSCEAVIAGADSNKLPADLRSYAYQIKHLFITQEPADGVHDIEDLISALEDSSCRRITIAHRLGNKSRNTMWENWTRGWEGTVEYLPISYVAASLALGVESVKSNNRPWITAITAANFSSCSLPLSKVMAEFGVENNLSEHVRHNRALLFCQRQAEAISQLPRHNHMGEPLELIEINSYRDIHPVLQHCAAECRFSITILCDLPLLDYLIDNKIVDEIVHHVTGIEGTENASADRSTDNDYVYSGMNIKFSEWKIRSCSPAGNCGRMVLRKHSFLEAYPGLSKNRFN